MPHQRTRRGEFHERAVCLRDLADHGRRTASRDLKSAEINGFIVYSTHLWGKVCASHCFGAPVLRPSNDASESEKSVNGFRSNQFGNSAIEEPPLDLIRGRPSRGPVAPHRVRPSFHSSKYVSATRVPRGFRSQPVFEGVEQRKRDGRPVRH